MEVARALYHDHEIDVFDRRVSHPKYHEDHYKPGALTPHRRRVAPIAKVHARGDDRLAHLLKRRKDGRAIKTPIHIKCWNDRHAGKIEHERRLMQLRAAEERKRERRLAQLRHKMHMAEKRAQEQEQAAQAHLAKCLLSHDNHLSWDSREVRKSLDMNEALALPAAGLESARMWRETVAIRPNPLQGVGYHEKKLTPRSFRRDKFVGKHHHQHARKGLAGPTLRRALALSPRAYPESIPERFMRRRSPAEERRREMISKIERRAWMEEQQRLEEEREQRSSFDLTLGKKVCESLRLNRLPLRRGGHKPTIRRMGGGYGLGKVARSVEDVGVRKMRRLRGKKWY